MKEINCQICKKRRELIQELNRIADKGGLFVREKKRIRDKISGELGYIEKLDECPACRAEKKPTAMNDFGADFEQTTHVHVCGVCGLRLPKKEDSAFKGTFVCSNLGEYENGELYEYKVPDPTGLIRTKGKKGLVEGKGLQYGSPPSI